MHYPLGILQAYKRKMAGKPPLVAAHDRAGRRRRWFWPCPLFFRLTVLMCLGRSGYIKLKWRWLRGEIRDRRLRCASFARMAVPIRRPLDYRGVADKLVDAQPLEEGGQKTWHE